MPTRLRAAAGCALILTLACSPKQMALNRMAAALASASSVYESDNDPEFVRLAAPSTLKTVEMLLKDAPGNTATAAHGMQRVHAVFLRVPARRSRGARAGRRRGQRSQGRVRRRCISARAGYCLRGLEVRHPGLTLAALGKDPSTALKATTVEDVPWIYWTAASWGAELSLASNQLVRVAELASVRALLNRAKALNEGGKTARSTRR